MARKRDIERDSVARQRVTEYAFDDDHTPTERVVRAVADATGRDLLDVEPLSTVLDPDALNALFDSPSRDGDTPDASVSFRFASCDVTVHADGRVVAAHVVDGR